MKRTLSNKMVWLLLHVVIGLALAGLLIWLVQPRLVFFPMKRMVWTPADSGLPYQDVRIETADGEQLAAWLVAAPPDRPQRDLTLLFLHGNAGNISHRGDSLRIFSDLGLDVLVIDYRGYGRSSGTPSEAGVYADAAAAWRWLTQEHGVPAGRILLFGRSLGGAVAAQLAGRLATEADREQQPAALIVESAFDAIDSLARHHYPLLAAVVPLRMRFPAAEAVARVRCPVLVLHSPEDEIVPYALGRRLFAAAAEPKRFIDLRGGHNQGFLMSQPGYQQGLAAFLDAHAQPQP